MNKKEKVKHLLRNLMKPQSLQPNLKDISHKFHQPFHPTPLQTLVDKARLIATVILQLVPEMKAQKRQRSIQ